MPFDAAAKNDPAFVRALEKAGNHHGAEALKRTRHSTLNFTFMFVARQHEALHLVCFDRAIFADARAAAAYLRVEVTVNSARAPGHIPAFGI